MRIAYLCHEPLPAASTYAEQLVSTVTGLAGQGIAVDVLHPASAAAPGDAVLRERLGRHFGIVPGGMAGSLRFVPVPGLLPARFVARKALHDLVSPLRALRRGHDLIYTRDLLAVVASLVAGARVVLETYRADVNTLARFAPWRRFCYRHPRFLGVVTHSSLARRSFLAAGLGEERVLLAYNGCPARAAQTRLSPAQARRALSLPEETPLVVYAGHVGEKKGTGILLDVAARTPGITLLAVGGLDGRLGREARKRGIDNLAAVGRVPPHAVDAYLDAADCLIVPPTAAPLRRHRRTVLPMKTFRYLAAGRPIVAPDLEDLREVLEHGRTALLVPPDDPGAAAAAIRRLVADPALGGQLGRNALEQAKRYTWPGRAERIAGFLERLATDAAADAPAPGLAASRR